MDDSLISSQEVVQRPCDQDAAVRSQQGQETQE